MLLKRRSFKSTLPGGELNIVSLMDVLTTLLFFLLVAANFSKLSAVNGFGVPSNLASKELDTKPRFTLEVILESQTQAMIWLGPIAELHVGRGDALIDYLGKYFGGNPREGFGRKIRGKDLGTLLATIQESLIPIKQSFPNETTAVLAVSDKLSYQELVSSVSALSSTNEKKPGFEIVSSLGRTTLNKVLFPQVVISEWTAEAPRTSHSEDNDG